MIQAWPWYWSVSRCGSVPVWPLPFALFAAPYKLCNGGTLWYDGNDDETRQVFWRQSQRYWRAVREGDIYTGGPFVGLPAY